VAVKLVAPPEYALPSKRTSFPWINSHHIAGDLRIGVQSLQGLKQMGERSRP
jgi:hypothetical protein